MTQLVDEGDEAAMGTSCFVPWLRRAVVHDEDNNQLVVEGRDDDQLVMEGPVGFLDGLSGPTYRSFWAGLFLIPNFFL